MGSKRLDKISDYARHGYAVKAECRECGRSAKLDARALSDDAIRRDRAATQMPAMRQAECPDWPCLRLIADSRLTTHLRTGAKP